MATVAAKLQACFLGLFDLSALFLNFRYKNLSNYYSNTPLLVCPGKGCPSRMAGIGESSNVDSSRAYLFSGFVMLVQKRQERVGFCAYVLIT